MSLWKKLFGEKEVSQPAPLTRYKVTFNFVDRTNGRTKTVTVPNATYYETYVNEGFGYAHMICVERDIQTWTEHETQALVSMNSEVVRG